MPKIKKKAKALMQPEDEIKSMAHHTSEFYQVYRKQFNVAIAAIVGLGSVAGSAIEQAYRGVPRHLPPRSSDAPLHCPCLPRSPKSAAVSTRCAMCASY